jgi:predicted nucleic acid-binding protein
MKPTFIDASFLIALAIEDDSFHAVAVEWQRVVRPPVFTTEYIILEFFDALTDESLRPLAVESIEFLRSDPAVNIVPASTSLMDEGITLFANRVDKTWGLTDCISFVVMESFAATDALTADRHFEQAGFNALLRRKPNA